CVNCPALSPSRLASHTGRHPPAARDAARIELACAFSNHLSENGGDGSGNLPRTLKNGHPGDEDNTEPLVIQGRCALTCAAPLCGRAELQLNETFSVRKFRV